jgi:hypothetical protein
MKIELNLTQAQILFISAVINKFVENSREKVPVMSRQEKTVYSIAIDSADKLHAKARILERGFDAKSKKKYKMTFKYHEAQGINYFVNKLKDSHVDDAPDSSYFNSLAQIIYLQLDPKL